MKKKKIVSDKVVVENGSHGDFKFISDNKLKKTVFYKNDP